METSWLRFMANGKAKRPSNLRILASVSAALHRTSLCLFMCCKRSNFYSYIVLSWSRVSHLCNFNGFAKLRITDLSVLHIYIYIYIDIRIYIYITSNLSAKACCLFSQQCNDTTWVSTYWDRLSLWAYIHRTNHWCFRIKLRDMGITAFQRQVNPLLSMCSIY